MKNSHGATRQRQAERIALEISERHVELSNHSCYDGRAQLALRADIEAALLADSEFRPAVCLDCGKDYADFPMDVILPRPQWLTIHPDDGGLLCAACIVARCAKVPRATCCHLIIEVAPPSSVNAGATTVTAGAPASAHESSSSPGEPR